jgi:hypothetical protein
MCHVAHRRRSMPVDVPRGTFALSNTPIDSRVREFDLGYIMGLVVSDESFAADR